MPRDLSTSSAGEATGSKVARYCVGVPARPAWIDRAQNPLVLARWVTTSCTLQPAHRLGHCHSSGSSVAQQRFEPAALPEDRVVPVARKVDDEDRTIAVPG